MPSFFDESRTQFSLGEKLASGGEGVVWRLQGTTEYLAKIYHPNKRASAEKLKALRSKSTALRNCAMLPVSLAFADRNLQTYVGVFIPFAPGHEIHQLYGPRSRFQYFPSATFKFLVRVAYNLAAAFEEIHGQGIIIGDVNEQNIKVLNDATVRIIDCDSFQITYNSKTFASNVGTPLWTAPELHGKDLDGLVRSSNHDQFGLAQLIFLLLFAGRYPFAGVPRTNHHLQPEEAIRQHAFAFAPEYLNLPLAPPPGCPRMDALPANLQKAFLRSFMSDSVRENARPEAGEWRRLLGELANELVACQHNSNHHFWKGAKFCPWCSVAKEVGIDYFPPTNPTFSFREPSTSSSYRIVPGPNPFTQTIPQPATGLKPSPLPPEPSGWVKGIKILFSSKSWKYSWLKPHLDQLRSTVQSSESLILELQSDQRSVISNYRSEFGALASKLKSLFDDLNQPSNVMQREMTAYAKIRMERELTTFLREFFIRGSSITQIGPARRATLISFGIETAAEITINSLRRAGLPANACASLFEWKKSCEARFKFDPKRAMCQSQIDEVKMLASKTMDKIRTEATAHELKINTLNNETARRLRDLDVEIRRVALRRDQAKLDVEDVLVAMKG